MVRAVQNHILFFSIQYSSLRSDKEIDERLRLLEYILLIGSPRNNQHLTTRRQTYRGLGVMDNVIVIGAPFVVNGLMSSLQLEPQGNFSGGFDHIFGQTIGFGDFGDTGSDVIDMLDVGGDMFDLVGDLF